MKMSNPSRRLDERQNRFRTEQKTTNFKESQNDKTTPVIGTCEMLEKDFFRLTSAPDPSKIRPLAVLERSFQFVMNKYRSNNDWRYISNQLKSIRQDLLVQSIRNDFALLVYQENARLALEMNDREQFIQCQSQIEILFDETRSEKDFVEFLIYRFLYSILLNDSKSANRISIEMENLEKSAEDAQRLKSIGDFASALRRKDFRRFFQLYRSLTNLEKSLVNFFLDIIRHQLIESLIRGFSPTVPIEFCREIGAFSSDDVCREKFRSFKLVFSEDFTQIDCKKSRNQL